MDQGKETRLVLRAQTGDRNAFDLLYLHVQEPLFRFISSICRERQLAEDVLQNVLFLIYRKIGWLREPKLFRPWCYRIATREAIKALKKQQQVDEIYEDSIAVESKEEQLTIDKQRFRELESSIDQLPTASRIVIVLHYLEELTIEEISEILGIPDGTVKSRLHYGLSKLRKNFARG